MVKLSVVFTFFVSLCSAATYYVAPKGHDTNPGTSISQAWATLQHAVDTVAPGDTILVETGTYTGCRISIPGGPSVPKTLQADLGATVVVNRPGSRNQHLSNIEIGNSGTTVTDWVISGLQVVNAPVYGIDVRNTDRITVQNNHVHNGFQSGIFTESSNDVVIQGNETDHNFANGIYDTGASSNALISGNTSHDNFQAGIQLDGGTAGGGGFFFFGPQAAGQVESATITANTIYNNGSFGAAAIGLDGADGSLISNNLIYNNHGTGVALYAIDGAHGSSNNQVLNNTIVMAAHAGYVIDIPQASPRKTAPEGNVIENNILYAPSANQGSILIASATVSGFVSDYNVVVNVFSDKNGAGKSLTLAQWQALGYDLHSLIATPAQLFADPPSAPLYQLAPNSPAIDAGTTLPNVPVDILGVSRPQGIAYDIGCYEAPQSSSDPQPPAPM